MKKMYPVQFFCIMCIFVFCAVSGTACGISGHSDSAGEPEVSRREGFAFNTVVQISLYGGDADGQEREDILDHCMELCAEYEAILSRTRQDSEVYGINRAAAETEQDSITVAVSEPVQELVEAGLRYAELSQGGFDITIGAVSRLWDFNGDAPEVPSQQEIAEGVARVDIGRCKLEGNMLTLKKGTVLDFGGIAKGYVADKLKSYLQESGIRHGLVNLGGNILLLGGKSDDEPFAIGIQKPFGQQNETLGAVKAKDISVVSSGVYERYFEKDGKRYHHILNPKTGMPYENHVLGVTVLSPTSLEGDGLSTTCFVLGIEEGIRLVDSMENVEVMYVAEDGEQYFSSGFKEYMQ